MPATVPSTEGQGYLSVHGGFSFYPTSAHRRRAARDASSGAPMPAAKRGSDVDVTPLTDATGRGSTSPSTSGLSRSPFRGAPQVSPRLRRSLSPPLTATPCRGHGPVTQAPAALTFARGGAPLLHRYRTSRADVSPRVRPRSASSPAPGAASGATTGGLPPQQSAASRGPFSNAHASAPPGRRLARASAAQRGMFADTPPAVPQRVQVLPTRVVAASPTLSVGVPDKEVPLTRVRLVGAAAPTSSTPASSLERAATDLTALVSARRHVSELPGRGVTRPASATCREEAACQEIAASRSSSAPARPELSSPTCVTGDLYCHDTHCVHSEQSICEFILMQRELRRCYASMENHESALVCARGECAAVEEQLRQTQREYAQHKQQVEAEVRAQVTEEVNALLWAQRRDSPAGERGPECETARAPAHSAAEAAEECWRGALQTTVAELQGALEREQAAHADTLGRLTAALNAKARWKARTVGLLKQREEVCRQMRSSSTAHSSSVTPVVERDADGTGAAVTAVNGDGRLTPNSTSPAPRLGRPPSPHKAPSGSARVDGSATPRAHAAFPSPPVHMDGGDVVGRKVGDCAMDVDVSRESDSTTESLSSPDTTLLGAEARAVGSGVVVVWPPLVREREEGTCKAAAPSLPLPTSSLTSKASAAPADLKTESSSPPTGAGARGLPASPLRPSRVAWAHSAWPQIASTGGAAVSCTPSGCAALRVDCGTPGRDCAQQRVTQDIFAFPRPPVASCSPGASDRHVAPGSALAVTTPDSAERRCQELLRALLDKERQLALVAEERTKYKRLYESARAAEPSSVETASTRHPSVSLCRT
ncbi:hypothetical protein NESM_000293400 [Novymonas esmeraldas]|uniref:Uncharacterized protein n=1 Tax=Novymonas esmeraldas TaxID=1808958 RepID=A0AAW0FFF1_9TRYP